MNNSKTLQVITRGEREVVVTRVFDAPRQLVFDAHTRCDLLKRWMFGPDGWSLAVCQVDQRAGGRYRYVWRHADKKEMGMGGVIREVMPPERLVATEKFDEAWYPGESVNTLLLEERGGRTHLTQIMEYESRAARDVAMRSGMEQGMAMGYDRLDDIFAAATGK